MSGAHIHNQNACIKKNYFQMIIFAHSLKGSPEMGFPLYLVSKKPKTPFLPLTDIEKGENQ
jgi:hypothetical protein